jgi:DNA repair exonuclease SbcCD ATPase subunit
VNQLFLSSVVFTDFRTFGAFEAEIVPAPGLTLLVGTNGLGKSSFFDAVEWGLTGEVRRFRSYMGATDQGKYLTRRGAPTGSHNVALEFSDGSIIERGSQAKPLLGEVIDLLKMPAWTAQIEDIGTYLAFTHFLGQAAQQRFTSRDRSEQWESLKGPSGIDRLDEVRNGLRGRATELAFNRSIQRGRESVAELERQLSEWQAWRARLDRLRDAAEAAGRMSAATFEQRLSLLAAEVAARAFYYADDPTRAPGDRLAAIGQALESLRRAFSSQQSAFQSLVDIPQRYTVDLAAGSPDAPALSAATSTSATAAAEVAAARAAIDAAREALADSSRQLADIEVQIVQLDAARSDLETAVLIGANLARSNDELESRSSELAQTRSELEAIEAELAAIDDRAGAIGSLTASLVRADGLADLADDLPTLRSTVTESVAVQSRAEQDAAQAGNQLANLISERNRISSDLEAARTQLQSSRSRATEVAAAVAAIAAHLHDGDLDCPICRTHFHPGQLRLLAAEAANAQDPTLAVADARVAELGRNLDVHAQRIASAEAVVRAAEDAAKRANAHQRALADLERKLAAALPTAVGDLLAAALDAQRFASEELSSAQARAADDQIRRTEANRRAAVLRTEDTRLSEETAALQNLAAAQTVARRSALERLAAAGYSEADAGRLDLAMADLRARQAQAITVRTTCEETVRYALEAETSALSRQESADDAVRRLTAARDAALAGASALELRWRNAGLKGVPNPTALELALSQLGEERRQVERLEDERSLMVRAYEAIARYQDLRDLMADMERVAGERSAEDPERYELQLQTRLKGVQEALHTTEEAHQAVGAFADKLREEAKNFSTRFLTPLNGLIDDFNEALLSTPGETVRLDAAYHKDRTQFDMRLHYRDKLDDALYDTGLPPQVVLSEGQLAANGFSILCAASTAYPWSRWRALLMDDPLQHNDIIHAAAFVDLMRNLVELRQYQLIMSSHDRGEAEFIRRKFDAAGLPCSVVNLTAPSRSGVRYLPPDHNSPARDVLTRRLARTG